MEINDRIRMMREIHQWSQEEMAGKMNMSLSGYAKIERGETKLHYDKLVQIAHIFNISVTDLVARDKRVMLCMNKSHDYIYTVYGNNNESLSFEIEKLKLTLSHKDELLTQKERELEYLRKIIDFLEHK